MSLDVAKLEKVRELAGGILQARCPACAEGGHDRTGEHLRIYPDGRFGCCVHPKDGEHRKRVFALVGVRKSGTFTLRVKTPPALPTAKSVKAALTTDSNPPWVDSRTPRTGNSQSCTRARVDGTAANIDMAGSHGELEDLESGVRDARTAVPPSTMPSAMNVGERLPFLTAGGALSIPFDSPERYHWWKPDGERLTVAETLQEVRAALAIKERMKDAPTV